MIRNYLSVGEGGGGGGGGRRSAERFFLRQQSFYVNPLKVYKRFIFFLILFYTHMLAGKDLMMPLFPFYSSHLKKLLVYGYKWMLTSRELFFLSIN